MKKTLKNLLIGAAVVTVGVITMIKKEKVAPKKRTEKELSTVPVTTKSNDTEKFVELMKQRTAAKKSSTDGLLIVPEEQNSKIP